MSNYALQFSYSATNLGIVTFPDHENLRPGQRDYSVSFWVKFGIVNLTLVSKSVIDVGVDNNTLAIGVAASGTSVYASLTDGTAGANTDSVIATGLDANEWTHVTLTRYHNQTDGLCLYINGTLAACEDDNNLNIDNTAGLVVGSIDADDNEDVTIDNLRIYNKVLSVNDVSQLYSLGRRRGAVDSDFVNGFYANMNVHTGLAAAGRIVDVSDGNSANNGTIASADYVEWVAATGGGLEAGLRTTLLADNYISENVSVYPFVVPQGKSLPAITYQRISTDHNHQLSGSAGFAVATVQVASWADNYNSAKEIAEYVRLLLDGRTGDMGEASVQSCVLDSETDYDYQDPKMKQRTSYSVQMTYRIMFNENKPVFI